MTERGLRLPARPYLAAALLVGAAIIGPVPARATAAPSASPQLQAQVRISAHRGGAGQWPQNSLLAFKNSLAAGYDEIEGDTYITADGYGVIYHDTAISAIRCTGAFAGRNIWTLTLRQIRTIRCEGQPIPTEGQLLSLVATSSNKHTVLRLETKSPRGQSTVSARSWAQSVGAQVVRAGLAGRAIMQDFNWAGIAGYHTASSRLRVSALIGKPTMADVNRAAALGAYDVSYNAPFETKSMNAYIAGKRMVPTVWGIDGVPPKAGTPTEQVVDAVAIAFRTAVCTGARVVITNYPGLAVKARSSTTC